MDRLFSKGRKQPDRGESNDTKRPVQAGKQQTPAPIPLRGLLKDKERPTLRNPTRGDNTVAPAQESSRTRRPSPPKRPAVPTVPATIPQPGEPTTLERLSKLDYLSTNPERI